MNVLRRLFPCKEVRQTLAALDGLQPLFNQGWASAGFDALRRRLRSRIAENPEAVKEELAANGNQPRIACLMAVAVIAREDLICGRNHVYRGRLSLVGTGKRTVYNIAMAELEKAGVCTPEVRRQRARELEQDIQEVG